MSGAVLVASIFTLLCAVGCGGGSKKKSESKGAPSSGTIVLTSEASTTHVFSNPTTETHTVTSSDGSFDSGLIPPGSEWPMAQTRPGEYPIYCSEHWDQTEEEGLLVITQKITSEQAQSHISEGLSLLGSNRSRAIQEFQEALSTSDALFDDAHRARARAGIAIARTINALGAFVPLLGAPRRQSSASTLIRSLFEPIAFNLHDAGRRWVQIEDPSSLAFSLSDIGIQTGSDPEDTIELSGSFGELEIRFLSFITHTLNAAAQLVLSHNLDVALDQTTLDLIENFGLDDPEEIVALRRAGALLAGHPDLLGFDNESRFRASRLSLVRAIDSLAGTDGSAFVRSLKATLAPPGSAIRPLMLIDSNSNGVLDTGDALRIPAFESIILSAGLIHFLDEIPAQLERIRDSLNPGSSLLLRMSDLNPWLAFLGYSAFPDFMAVRPSAWFDHPKSLREILPVTFPDGSSTSLAVEAELSAASPIVPDGKIVKSGDSAHFAGLSMDGITYAIPADLIAPPESDDDELVPYFGFRDPTLGGVFLTNLLVLDTNVAPDLSSCSTPTESFCPATLYSINAVIAYFDAIADF